MAKEQQPKGESPEEKAKRERTEALLRKKRAEALKELQKKQDEKAGIEEVEVKPQEEGKEPPL